MVLSWLCGCCSDKVELDEPTGTLRSKLVYDRERIPDFRVKVQIRDSGSPPQTAVGNIKVEVLDENDNPSEPRNMNVVIKTFEGVFPGGRVADVRPTDPDLKGEYSCKLLRGAESIFRVEPDCQVSEEGFTRVALARAHGPQTHGTICGLDKDITLSTFSKTSHFPRLPLAESRTDASTSSSWP